MAFLICLQDRLVTGKFGKGLPLLVFGSLSVVAGLLAIILPETLGKDLTETIQEELQSEGKESSDTR